MRRGSSPRCPICRERVNRFEVGDFIDTAGTPGGGGGEEAGGGSNGGGGSSGFKFTSNGQLKDAAKEWVRNKERAKGKYGKIEDWDVSKVTSFQDLFKYARDFNEDLSRWDVSKVTFMYRAFQEASSFNSDLSKWDTSNCTDMTGMFHNCSSFNSDLSKWDTSNCTGMSRMFYGATAMSSSHKPKCVPRGATTV